MPSFLEGLARLVKGEPVFKQGEDVDGPVPKQAEPTDASPEPQAVQQQGPKVIPDVFIQQVKYRNNGSGTDMDVDVDIQNHSDRNIMVDKINILGVTYQIDRVLSPGEMREVQVYSGPRPNHRNYTNCELQYRDETTGDYFASVHFVEYQQESDQSYVPIRIRFVPPVKDI